MTALRQLKICGEFQQECARKVSRRTKKALGIFTGRQHSSAMKVPSLHLGTVQLLSRACQSVCPSVYAVRST